MGMMLWTVEFGSGKWVTKYYRLQGTHLITETLFPLDQEQTKENIFSSNRVVEVWNALPIPIKEAPTLNKFKFLLDEHRASQ